MEKIPAPWQHVLGRTLGNQFTPADVLVALSITHPEIIEAKEPWTVTLTTEGVPGKGIRVEQHPLPKSSLQKVTKISASAFETAFLQTLEDWVEINREHAVQTMGASAQRRDEALGQELARAMGGTFRGVEHSGGSDYYEF